MRIVIIAWLLAALPAMAQQSASFSIEEHTLNNGGTPASGAVSTSAGFRIGLSSIGDPFGLSEASSGSFRLASSFPAAFPPPGEVAGLGFAASKQALGWSGERSRGSYNLYRGLFSSLSGLGYGACTLQGIPGEAANVPDVPPTGDGFFYLVSVVNRLGEEGTKGYQSNGTTERLGAVCP